MSSFAWIPQCTDEENTWGIEGVGGLVGGALEIEKGALWELRAEDVWPVANSDNLSRFLQLPSELCQKAADEDGGCS